MIANPIQAGDGDSRHGTINGYNNHKCHCEMCTTAKTEWMAEYRTRPGKAERHNEVQRESAKRRYRQIMEAS